MTIDIAFMKSLWTVWLGLLFVGIVAWTLLPSRRPEHEAHARIPFQDEDA